jgi:hypothetical protein
MRKNQTETFPLSPQQLFYVMTVDGHVTKTQGQRLMDAKAAPTCQSANPNPTKQLQNKPTKSFS